MLQCNRYPGLDANEIIRLTSAIGHKLPVTKASQKQSFATILYAKSNLETRMT